MAVSSPLWGGVACGFEGGTWRMGGGEEMEPWSSIIGEHRNVRELRFSRDLCPGMLAFEQRGGEALTVSA
jgi:hypothetical protein